MRHPQRTALHALRVLPLAVLIGCTAGTTEPGSSVAMPDAPAGGCPALTPEADGPIRSHVAIDYVDFVDHDGRRYLAGSNDAPPVAPADLGEVILRSACSFSAFNERTGRDPGRPRDGDTGFLPPGTTIHAVRGWAPECRLAAERDGQVHAYLALDPTAERARPAPCAPG